MVKSNPSGILLYCLEWYNPNTESWVVYGSDHNIWEIVTLFRLHSKSSSLKWRLGIYNLGNEVELESVRDISKTVSFCEPDLHIFGEGSEYCLCNKYLKVGNKDMILADSRARAFNLGYDALAIDGKNPYHPDLVENRFWQDGYECARNQVIAEEENENENKLRQK